MAQTVPQWLQGVLLNPGPGHAGLVVATLANAGAVTAEMVGAGGFELTSAAFLHGEELDPSFTADEEDSVAPPLEWTAPPAGSQELVLVVEDPDAPGKVACHWLVWGLAAQRGKLLEGEVPPRVGKNAHGNSEWLLPAPPQGDEPHDYVFQLFALDQPLALMPGASREDLVKAMTGHVSAVAILTGTYAREEADEDWENWEAEDAD
ncbi:YbhB/YbcL family Raf kinase inhibitor-like protein [Alteraurantiacibacter buctensis]|nr:YbhB/YbcL family Raf kinase inhibitor-like protein [Alteraurantiacibacter buctensis]